MTCVRMRLPLLLLLAGCAAAPRPAPVAPPPAATPSAAAPSTGRASPGPGFADARERARKLAAALPEVEGLFADQFAARKPPGMAVARVELIVEEALDLGEGVR